MAGGSTTSSSSGSSNNTNYNRTNIGDDGMHIDGYARIAKHNGALTLKTIDIILFKHIFLF